MRVASDSMRCMAAATSSSSRSPPCRYSSENPRMVTRGVRSSWEASCTKRRILSSEISLSRNADSMCASIALRERESRPTSVSGAALSTRWLRSPAAILAAVRSTRFRVRNARWTARLATITVPAVASRPMVTTIEVTRSTEEVTLCRGRATAMVPSPLLSPYSCTRQPLESGCVPGTSKEAEPRSRASAGVMSGRAGSSASGITGVWTTRAPSLSHTTP